MTAPETPPTASTDRRWTIRLGGPCLELFGLAEPGTGAVMAETLGDALLGMAVFGTLGAIFFTFVYFACSGGCKMPRPTG